MGSMNFALFQLADRYPKWKHEWERPYLAETDDYIFRNTFRDIAKIMEILGKGHGVRFEHECYDVGHLYNLAHFVDRKVVEPPFFVQIIFGILGGIGADIRNLMFMKETADRLFGDAYRWSVLGAGRHQMPFATQAAMMGGNVRVGLEDSLYIGPGEMATEQRPAGRQDPSHHRGTRLRGRDTGRGARDAGAEGRRQGRLLGERFSRRRRGRVPAAIRRLLASPPRCSASHRRRSARRPIPDRRAAHRGLRPPRSCRHRRREPGR